MVFSLKERYLQRIRQREYFCKLSWVRELIRTTVPFFAIFFTFGFTHKAIPLFNFEEIYMAEKGLINMGDYSEAAKLLVEKVGQAVGGALQPWQMKRIATAEVEVERIKSIGQVELQNELQERAFRRMMYEEGRKQENLEKILLKSMDSVEIDSKPNEIDTDWLQNFIEKCKTVSNEEMQTVWAKLLSRESNNPGAISRRTVELVSSFDKSDAQLFEALCKFVWSIGHTNPVIFEYHEKIYSEQGINFISLKHLEGIGLVSFESNGYFTEIPTSPHGFRYYNRVVRLKFDSVPPLKFRTGQVIFTKAGRELVSICGTAPVEGFLDYCIGRWKKFGYDIEEAQEPFFYQLNIL